MDDGEYRATLRETWPMVFPPLVLLGVGVWVLVDPARPLTNSAAVPISLFFIAACLAIICLGLWVWSSERLDITTDTLGYTQTGKAHWRLRWSEIRSVRVSGNPSVETVSYTITLESTRGESRIRTAFLPVSGPELAHEICRRSGATLGR